MTKLTGKELLDFVKKNPINTDESHPLVRINAYNQLAYETGYVTTTPGMFEVEPGLYADYRGFYEALLVAKGIIL